MGNPVLMVKGRSSADQQTSDGVTFAACNPFVSQRRKTNKQLKSENKREKETQTKTDDKQTHQARDESTGRIPMNR